MGLDQYLFKTKVKPEEIESAKSNEEIQSEEFAYWRKHPNLQGYMKNVFLEKNKDVDFSKKSWSEDFNGDNVYLTEEDLNEWETTAKNKKYPPTTGFFFGSDSDDDYLEYDLETIQKAREALKEGFTVYYTSWW